MSKINSKNILTNVNPEILLEWDYEKNSHLSPYLLSCHSKEKVWWICKECKNNWRTRIDSKAKGAKCPICSMKYKKEQARKLGKITMEKAIKKGNTLANLAPELAKEFDINKNNDLTPDNVARHSNQIIYWKCKKGHEWKATPNSRKDKSSCPYCIGKKIPIEKSLSTTHPELLKEWDFDKNKDLNPKDITFKSIKKVYWKCEKGHEWKQVVTNRINSNSKCPYCSNKKAHKEYNLDILFPQLMIEWNFEKNKKKPEEYIPNSNSKVWWKCKTCNSEWDDTIRHRAIEKRNCPFCRRFRINNTNSIAYTHPHLLEEWDFDKNKKTPYEVSIGSHYKAWWKCKNGHKWRIKVHNRGYNNCPKCHNGGTSYSEQAIFYYIKKIFNDALNRHTFKFQSKKVEVDIFIPSLKIAIEFDGYFYHKEKKIIDEEKNKFLKENGIKLIRVRENINEKKLLPILNPYGSVLYDVYYRNQVSLEKAIYSILLFLQKDKFKPGKIDIDLSKERINILSNYIFKIKENNIRISDPNVAKEWNKEKNGELKAESFTSGSNKKVWWKCIKGHEWEATIYSRTNKEKALCPYCCNKRPCLNNCLATVNPRLAKEWHPEKNGELTPYSVVSGSSKKIWWICDKKHEWESSLYSRTGKQKTGCPYCVNKKVTHMTSFSTNFPHLVSFWDKDKNGTLTPDAIVPGTSKKIYWKCKKGHEWILSPHVMIKRKKPCLKCK